MYRILDWLSCASDLRRARAARVEPSQEEVERLRSSRLALEVGDKVLNPLSQPRLGSGAAHAAELFRQALHWALSAGSASTTSEAEQEHALQAICPDPEQLAALRHLLSLEQPFVFFAGLAEEQQRTTALFLRLCAVRALERQEAPRQAVERLRALRWIRLAIIPLLGMCLALTTLAFLPEKPNLAKDKPWRTSSSAAQCDPKQGMCAGVRTLILFHTNYENNAWFEYDLGAPLRFSSMTIRNRSDGESERAVPLIVEVSNDGTTYREVARRNTDFAQWKPDLGPQEARYVRLRVPRPTYFHLEEVKIHP
jgi:hypothetical protein